MKGRSWFTALGLLACSSSEQAGGGGAGGADEPLRGEPMALPMVSVAAAAARPALPPAPGAACESAVPLTPAGATAVLGAAATDADPSDFGCAPPATGASAHFELDLSAESQPVPVQIVLDAPFAFDAVLTRGPCGDARTERCATPLYADERSRVVAATLEPDRYRLLITAAAREASAAVHASVLFGALTCSEPPAHDSCARAQPLDTSKPAQSVSGTLACARPELAVRCASAAAAEVFYELDLSERHGPTLLDVAVTAAEGSHVSASLLTPSAEPCGEVLMCGTQLSARVPPGKYRLAVSAAPPPGGERHPALPAPPAGSPSPFALRVQLSEPNCVGLVNDSWNTALELDTTLPVQLVKGNTACGTHQPETACELDRGAPDLFYRLDLRSSAAPRTLYARNLLGLDTITYLLRADEDGGSPRPIACEAAALSHHHWYVLAPRLYYLVVDGVARNAGHFELELELGEADEQRASCATAAIQRCMADSEPACNAYALAPSCLTTAIACGLEPGAVEEFCDSAPGCCTGEDELDGCLEAWADSTQCR